MPSILVVDDEPDLRFVLHPRIESRAPRPPALGGPRRAFVNEGLDRMTGGGLPPGEATLVMGPSGAGKTVMAAGWIGAGLDAGEQCLYISFEESRAQLVNKAETFGWGFREALERGDLTVLHIPPIELDVDELAYRVRNLLQEHDYSRVVVDSLGELVPVSSELGRFPGFLWALATTVTAEGASLVFTQETTAFGPAEARFAKLSYLFHNVLLLRYMEVDAEIGRSMMVLKMRESDHEKRLVAFDITDDGIHMKGLVDRADGILGGPALRAEAIVED